MDQQPPEKKRSQSDEKGGGPDQTAHLHDQIDQLSAENESLRAGDQAWESSFRKYHDLYENAPVAFFILEKNGIVDDCNKTAAELLGRDVDHLLSRSFARFVRAADRQALNRHITSVIETGARQTLVIELEKPQPTFVQIESDRLSSPGGQPRCRSAVVDITARVEAERAAEKAKLLTEGIVRTIREPIAVLDQMLRIGFVNPAFRETFALGAGEVENVAFLEMDGGVWDIEGLRGLLETVISHNQPIEALEVEREFPRVGKKTLLLSARVMVQEKRWDPRVLIAIHDITAHRQAKELEAYSRELDAFNQTVSHDLRAPLRVVLGFSRILREDYGEHINDKGQHLLDSIERNVQKMSTMVDSLLRLSQLGRSALSPEEVDMERLSREVFDEVKQAAPTRFIELRMSSIPPASADPALIRQVWTNLLTNAVKFTSRKNVAVIEIGGWSGDDSNTYFVKDNGAGFSSRYAGKLFMPFQRLHSESEFPGTGVGLSTVWRIIKRHGGRIWAEAEEGKGARFYFSLPRFPRE